MVAELGVGDEQTLHPALAKTLGQPEHSCAPVRTHVRSLLSSIATIDVACVDLVGDIEQFFGAAVGEDHIRHVLELVKVLHDP